MSTGTPFSSDEAAGLANVFLDDIGRLKQKIADFEGPVVPDFPTLTRTKAQLEFVAQKLVVKDYMALVPEAVCCACLETTQSWESCNCGAVLCVACFESRLEQHKALGWNDPCAVSNLASLRCDFCKGRHGGFDVRLLKQLSARGSDLHREVVRMDARILGQYNGMLEENRRLSRFRELPSAESMLYASAKEALVDLATTKTPCCQRPWVEFEGCAALECEKCRSYFCALCLHGNWNRAECHLHVASCRHRPASMEDAHFLPMDLWKKQNALRQHRIAVEWLQSKDFPANVQAKLLEDFPKPDEMP